MCWLAGFPGLLASSLLANPHGVKKSQALRYESMSDTDGVALQTSLIATTPGNRADFRKLGNLAANEPASLVLFGTALAIAGLRLRKNRPSTSVR